MKKKKLNVYICFGNASQNKSLYIFFVSFRLHFASVVDHKFWISVTVWQTRFLRYLMFRDFGECYFSPFPFTYDTKFSHKFASNHVIFRYLLEIYIGDSNCATYEIRTSNIHILCDFSMAIAINSRIISYTSLNLNCVVILYQRISRGIKLYIYDVSIQGIDGHKSNLYGIKAIHLEIKKKLKSPSFALINPSNMTKTL